MVWKIIARCLLVGCLLLASPMQALAYSVYDEGNISSTYKDIFVDILNDVDITDDYVFFRSGQYEYTMVCGDLTYSGGVFYADEYSSYVVDTTTNGYNNSIYNYSFIEGNGFSLDTSNRMVYSNLGHFPNLIERGAYYEYATLVLLVIFGICLLVRPMFRYTYRFRG